MRLFSTIIFITLLFSGCATKTYTSQDIGEAMYVKYGEVTSVKPVTLQRDETGKYVGAVAGGVLGGQLGGGSKERVGMAVVGTLLGAFVGSQLDNNQGQQVIVKLEDGGTVATIMPINDTTPNLFVGQKVQVFYSGSKIKNITPLQNYRR